MKISETRRMRGEKKAKARHEHQAKQNSRFIKKFEALALAIAKGDEAGAKDAFAKMETILSQAGKTTEDLQERVNVLRKELAE